MRGDGIEIKVGDRLEKEKGRKYEMGMQGLGRICKIFGGLRGF